MFTLRAPSKINVCLKITGRRENGYHELFNLMTFLDVADSIKVKENKSVFPSVFMAGKYGHLFDNFHASSVESNTIMKALDFMHGRYRTPMNFDISVSKEIPVAAGLGGSSSDAGAIVAFVAQYFGIDMSQDDIDAFAKEATADGPFFTQNETCLCEGIGEKMTPLSIDPASEPVPILIVYPDFGLSAGDIYRLLSKSDDFFPEDQVQTWREFVMTPNINFKHLITEAVKLGNDLLAPAVSVKKEIKILTDLLAQCKGAFGSGMSGSGSACFALFDNGDDLQAASAELSARLPAFEFIPSRLLPRFERQNVVMSSRPAMEMIFHPSGDENDWETIK